MDKIIEKKFWNTKKIVSLGGGAVLLFIFLFTFVFADHQRKLNVEKERLSITEVVNAPFQEYIPITGTVEPIQTFWLDLSEGGKVVEKYVQEGAMLKAGDPIVRLDNPNLSLQVMNTQSSFLQAEGMWRQTRLSFEQGRLGRQGQLLGYELDLMNFKREYKNNKVLYSKGLISQNEFESSEEKYETMKKSIDLLKQALKSDSLTFNQLMQQNEANMEMSKEHLALVQNQLASLTVRAPIKGQLTSLNAEIGQSVGGGYRLGQIDNIDSFKVRAEIDEHYISRVVEGQTGEFEFDNKTFTMVIKTVYPQVTNGRFFVDMVFVDNQPRGIRRGQTLHIKLQLGGLSNALLVESGGFYSTTGGQWIFVLDKSGAVAEKRSIKIGRQNPQYYEVLEGLKEGEKVITSSYDNYDEIEKLVLK